jgi:hypothetical protein
VAAVVLSMPQFRLMVLVVQAVVVMAVQLTQTRSLEMLILAAVAAVPLLVVQAAQVVLEL